VCLVCVWGVCNKEQALHSVHAGLCCACVFMVFPTIPCLPCTVRYGTVSCVSVCCMFYVVYCVLQAKLAFVTSMMLNIDELANERHMFLSKVEFYEAVRAQAVLALSFPGCCIAVRVCCASAGASYGLLHLSRAGWECTYCRLRCFCFDCLFDLLMCVSRSLGASHSWCRACQGS